MRRMFGLAGLLAVSVGCEEWRAVQEAFEGFSEPTVVQALILAVAEPESEAVDLSVSEFQPGTGATVFLANASDAQNIEEAPIEGATVSVHEIAAIEQGDGAYVIDPGTLEYAAGATWAVTAEVGEGSGKASVVLPNAAAVTLPEQHTAGQDLLVDVAGQGFHAALVVVFDVATGAVTWSNEPQDAQELYDFTHGSADVESVTIPGAAAFPAESAYAVGVAGMMHGDAESIEGFNTLLSTAMAGQMKMYPVSTSALPTGG